jgi:hypothetical protein
MLIAVLTLGGAILGATSIAGLLMLYQIRATTDSEGSAKAIFAADSGVEWALFDTFCDVTSTPNPITRCIGGSREQAQPVFSNGSSLSAICYDASSTQLSQCDGAVGVPETAISKGSAQNAKRAFFVDLTASTTSLP